MLVINNSEQLGLIGGRLRGRGFFISALKLCPSSFNYIRGDSVMVFPIPAAGSGRAIFYPRAGQGVCLDRVRGRLAGRLVLYYGCDFTNGGFVSCGALSDFSLLGTMPATRNTLRVTVERASCAI